MLTQGHIHVINTNLDYKRDGPTISTHPFILTLFSYQLNNRVPLSSNLITPIKEVS